MQNTVFRFGPYYIANAAANILNPTVTSLAGPIGVTLTQPYILIKHIRIVNKTGSAATFTLYIGASAGSAGGTEVMGASTSVAANSSLDFYPAGGLRLDAADFLTGIASAASALVFTAEGEIGFS